MQDYRPPTAPVADSGSARRRPLAVAIVLGVAASIGVVIGLSAALAAILLLGDPTPVRSSAEVPRRLGLSPYTTFVIAGSYVLSGMVGGWCATRFRRGSWAACGVGVGSVLTGCGLALAFGHDGNANALTSLYAILLPAALVGGYLAQESEKPRR